MLWRSAIAAAGFAAAVVGGAFSPAHAQSAREAEIVGFHQLCEMGNRRARVHFGILIGENRALHAEWRRLHPGWWWWER